MEDAIERNFAVVKVSLKTGQFEKKYVVPG